MSDVTTQKRDGVLEIVWSRPAKKNALTVAMYAAVVEALEAATRDDAVRAVLFAAEGGTFTAGNDVIDFMNGLGEGEPPVLRFIKLLATFPKPMIAAVQGPAVGIGATMLLHCDLVYATEEARLIMPFVSLGLVPEAGSSILLPRRVGDALAAEMILLGSPLEARRALAAGLVNAIVAPAELRDHAFAKAKALAAQPPRALALSRKMLRADATALVARIEEEAAAFAACLVGAEAREAFTAFLERRAPDFSKLA